MARHTRHLNFETARALLVRGAMLQETKHERGSDYTIPGAGAVTPVTARQLLSDPHCRAADAGLFGIPQTWTLKCRKVSATAHTNSKSKQPTEG